MRFKKREIHTVFHRFLKPTVGEKSLAASSCRIIQSFLRKCQATSQGNDTPRAQTLVSFSPQIPGEDLQTAVIGRFIVDFYCACAKLVIEIDGTQHYEPQGMAYDAERSVFLSALGLEVLRFWSRDIDRDFRGV